MTARPQPRKSALAGSSPALPAAKHPADVPAPTVGPKAASAAPRPSRTAADPEPRAAARKVSFYQDPSDAARMRAALLNTQHLEGPRTLSEFIARAVLAEVERLEQSHNRGKPWAPVTAGQLPQGRPVRG